MPVSDSTSTLRWNSRPSAPSHARVIVLPCNGFRVPHVSLLRRGIPRSFVLSVVLSTVLKAKRGGTRVSVSTPESVRIQCRPGRNSLRMRMFLQPCRVPTPDTITNLSSRPERAARSGGTCSSTATLRDSLTRTTWISRRRKGYPLPRQPSTDCHLTDKSQAHW
jgi:hypothetical protein